MHCIISSLVGTPIAGALLRDSNNGDLFSHAILFGGVTVTVGGLIIIGTRFAMEPRLAKV